MITNIQSIKHYVSETELVTTLGPKNKVEPDRQS
jgi:hypothetical protein